MIDNKITTSKNGNPRPPPIRQGTVFGWLRANLFSTPLNGVLTLFSLFIIYNVFSSMFDWAVLSASMQGVDRTACLGTAQGACWPFVTNKISHFIYGNYPEAERWRVNLVFLFGAVGLAALVLPLIKDKRRIGLLMLTVYPIASYILLIGDMFGLAHVETRQWGGLLVTLVIAVTGIVFSLPLGILLALGRMSNLPVIHLLCVCFIEVLRGVPLIMVLFMASVMFPLFLPEGVNFDLLLRCLIGVALFSAVYMAEVVRGGLQAIPQGQYEAASAMGLSYWKSMRFIILPQALTISIPGIVNTFIGMFKDTTLVMIVGIFDLLGIIQFHTTADANWAAPQVPVTGYVFAGAVFWVFCFIMSRYSLAVEKRLALGQKD